MSAGNNNNTGLMLAKVEKNTYSQADLHLEKDYPK